MRRERLVMVVTALAALSALSVAGAGATRAAQSGLPAAAQVASGSIWANAIKLPGSVAVNASGNDAVVLSVSCPSAGNCAAGGYYTDGSANNQAFVASQRNGRWGSAIKLPGLAALNAGGNAVVLSVSCPSAGNCAAGGYYTDRATHQQAFVDSQRSGRWSTAIEVPGSAALNPHGNDWVYSVSCPSVDRCTAGGYYTDGSYNIQAFVASQQSGRWGGLIELPGSAALNTGGNAVVLSVSCPSAGSCTAGGEYVDGLSRFQAFVASEENGRWGRAIKLPGSAVLNAGGVASVNWVSCPSAGNCTAGGYYTDHAHRNQALVATERNGRWGNAIKVPGTATLNARGNAQVYSVSCPSAGNCVVGGYYADRAYRLQAFVATERNDRWGNAIKVPGTATLNARGNADVLSVSCPSAGNCAVGGEYADRSAHFQAFVASERNGRWGTAIEVPGTAALNAGGNAQVFSVSCPSAGNCTAGGDYTDSSSSTRGLVATEHNSRWGTAINVPQT
jgi:hypothetical protein